MSNIRNLPALNSLNMTIDRFRKVDNNLYRGACPKWFQFKEIKDNGFDYVVSLRSGFDAAGKAEKNLVESLGMEYKNFPIDSRKGPQKKVLEDFFEFTDDLLKNNKKAFVHCKHGRDRTGTLVALYEMKNNIKSFHGALLEFFSLGYNHPKHPHLFELVKKFSDSIK